MKWHLNRVETPNASLPPEDTAFGEFFRSIILEIPSLFERLTYVSSFVSTNNLRRLCHEFCECHESILDQRACEHVIQRHHRDAFHDWCELRLEQKLAHLEDWAKHNWKTRDELADEWLLPRSIDHLMPSGTIDEAQAKAFRGDLDLLLPFVLIWEM